MVAAGSCFDARSAQVINPFSTGREGWMNRLLTACTSSEVRDSLHDFQSSELGQTLVNPWWAVMGCKGGVAQLVEMLMSGHRHAECFEEGLSRRGIMNVVNQQAVPSDNPLMRPC